MNAAKDTYDLVIVTPNLDCGGTQRIVAMLANAWNGKGYRICIICAYHKGIFFPLDRGIRLVDRMGTDGRKSWFTKSRVYKFFHWSYTRLKDVDLREYMRKRHDYHGIKTLAFLLAMPGLAIVMAVVHTWELLGGIVYTYWRCRGIRTALKEVESPLILSFLPSANIMSVIASTNMGRRVVICERNDPAIQPIPQPWRMLRPIVYHRASLVTVNSGGAAVTLEKYVPQDRIRCVPNPILLPEGTQNDPTGNLADRRQILIVGRLHEQKAHSVLLRAFAKLPESLADWRLSVVGKGELLDRLQQQGERLGIADRVTWFGAAKDVKPFYRHAAMFVLPSLHEGMPNALLEAMSFGVPSIISDASSGPMELVTDQENGLVVPAGDADALAKAIERLATDVTLRTRLGKAAYERALENSLPRILPLWEQTIGLAKQADGEQS